MAEKCEEDKLKVKKINHICIADFDVASSEASLEEVEACMNRMIEKHKEFAERRRVKVLSEHNGMFG